MNFVNALEKIPGIIAQYEERTAKLKADVPQLEVIISKTWGKEDELKQLKSELAALDRKITAELAPKHDENDGAEVKQEQFSQTQTEVKAETTVKTVNVHTTDPPQGHKLSMVAEPHPPLSNVGKYVAFSGSTSLYLIVNNRQIRPQCLVCLFFLIIFI